MAVRTKKARATERSRKKKVHPNHVAGASLASGWPANGTQIGADVYGNTALPVTRVVGVETGVPFQLARRGPGIELRFSKHDRCRTPRGRGDRVKEGTETIPLENREGVTVPEQKVDHC